MSAPTTNFIGFTQWSRSINDSNMFGKARLTLTPAVQTYGNDTTNWLVRGPYDFNTRQFPLTNIAGQGWGFAATITQGLYQVSMQIDNPNFPSRVFDSEVIVVKNILIVSIGDSYASGEGNPEKERINDRPAVWADDKLPGHPSNLTHRSRYAAPFQAAFELGPKFSNSQVEPGNFLV